MDRKGFTLVELLATVFIISLLFGIATYSVIGTINNSKKKSEEIFVDKIAVAIDEYIGLYGSEFKKKPDASSYVVEKKCYSGDCAVNAYEYYKKTGEDFKLSDLVNENLFDDNKLINPVNKLNCLNGNDPVIRVFKDQDYVYYYYVDLSGSNTSCEISSENGVIDTRKW